MTADDGILEVMLKDQNGPEVCRQQDDPSALCMQSPAFHSPKAGESLAGESLLTVVVQIVASARVQEQAEET